MIESALLFGVVLFVVGGAYVWQAKRLRQRALARLETPISSIVEEDWEAEPPRGSSFLRRYFWLTVVAGAIVFCVLFYGIKISLLFSITLGMMVFLLGTRLETWWAAKQKLKIEYQLANAIDLMISGLQAGGSVLSGLEIAVRETRNPLRVQLEEVLGRIRYGDDPAEVLRALEQRVPLETFRLFSSALAIHWEVGGSLSPILARVGRTIRDRLELQRRIHSLTTQARVSNIAILATTYFIALVVWRNDPQRMESFLSTSIGEQLVAFAMLMQVLGIVWTSALSQLRY